MSSRTKPASRTRSSYPGESARSRFRRPRHAAQRTTARHRKPVENDLTKPSHLLRYVALAAITVLVAVGIRSYAIQLFFIPSASMEPTLCGGNCPDGNDRILVNKVAYRLGSPDHGDIVVFARPHILDGQTPDKDLVKRVIAVAGDTIRWSGQSLWLNNIEQHESYVNPVCNNSLGATTIGSVTVPAGDVFVMGDNRCDSTDSRVFGPIATSSVVGKAFMIVWPAKRISLL
ncbi:signal peptidase I [Jatrophihabitans sp. GAS493]|uniref:signal peptidase I n=1 Tax=Jatrophihabitans sp. GAS493 TaxID=1907575 RepID=UPI000BB80506|nr:signal peptidase I [Jatrophihabitans sp. GAS493]SOD73877.1 signal peptidase I [Jatrophihabitans sp. GAS493]